MLENSSRCAGKEEGEQKDPETCQKSFMALASVPVTSDKIDTIGRRQKLCYPSRRENACTWWERTNIGLYCGLTSTLTDRSPPPGLTRLTPWRVEWLDNPFCDSGYL